MEELDSSKKKEKYARKSFEENRDQDHVTSTVWNHKNVAYSGHDKHHSDYYLGSQEFDDSFNKGSSSTTITTSRRRLSSCLVAWLVIGLLLIAAGGVTTYFVYLSNSSNYDPTTTTVPSTTSANYDPTTTTVPSMTSANYDPTTTTVPSMTSANYDTTTTTVPSTTSANNDPTTTTVPSTTSGPYELLWFIGDITIYKNSWDPDLLNKSSQKCQEMMENVTVMIDAVYKASTLEVVYIKSTVQSFRSGSTVADVILSFAISPEFREVLDAGLVNTAFQEVVKNGSVEETKQFDIDTAKINFKVIGDVACDFENSSVCGYDIGDKFVWREGFVHHLPSIDHTYGNESGHYMFFTSQSRDTGILTTSYVSTSIGGCFHFFFNMEGGASAELKTYITYNTTKLMTFYASGMHVKTDEWVEGFFSVSNGGIFTVSFETYGDIYYLKPSVVAIDDVSFREGESCPVIQNCSSGYHKCETSGVCIPQFLVFDGYNDCLDGSDERNDTTMPSETPTPRLVGGKLLSSGRLEIQLNQGDVYKTVCTSRWDEDDTKVVCRELGYSNSRFLKLSEYGRGRLERETLSYQFYCNGFETKLSDCLGGLTSPCTSEKVAIQCSNSVCFDGERSCGNNGTYSACILNELWCNGNVDCPNAADEITCVQCNQGEFECNDHKCISQTNRCDGMPQCDDRSDEFRCVIRNDTNSQISVNRGGEWNNICYTDDALLAKYLCNITGYGPYTSSGSGDSITDGITLIATDNPNGIIKNYQIYDNVSCQALILECGDFECGVASISPTLSESYMLFGNDAVNGEWPWQALLFLGTFSTCGATLIDAHWAVTAAHCVDGYSFSIHVGEVKESEMGTKGQRLSVTQVIKHEEYEGFLNSYSHDIALLRLSPPAHFNSYVRPACIATEIHTNYEYCFITGWGITHYEDGFGIVSDNLKEVQVDVNVDVDRCNKSIQTFYDSRLHVPANGICVDNKNPHSPACHGDSGGPLICRNLQGRWELVGVTSFGVSGCFTDHIPAIYQSVPHNLEWIKQKTGLYTNGTTTPPPTTMVEPINGTCGGHFTSLTGSFASPNYPGNYPSYANCTYTIIVPVDHYITLSFQIFNTESDFDYVKVYDGWSNSHPQLRSISGSWGSSIVPVVSSNNSLFVWFTSDGSVQRKGFSANYESRIIG